jgi:hypothetical protein
VHSVARMFEDAGVARTERSITNWCKRDNNGVSRLDCYYDPNEGKYFITPQSVERAIEEERAKINSTEIPNVSEPFGTIQKPSETFRNVPNISELSQPEQSVNQQNEKTNLSPELMKELEDLRIDKKVWERERQFYDKWFVTLEKERDGIIPQIAELNKSVGYLEAKNENLEKANQRLLTQPIHNATRIVESHYMNETDDEDDSVGGES